MRRAHSQQAERRLLLQQRLGGAGRQNFDHLCSERVAKFFACHPRRCESVASAEIIGTLDTIISTLDTITSTLDTIICTLDTIITPLRIAECLACHARATSSASGHCVRPKGCIMVDLIRMSTADEAALALIGSLTFATKVRTCWCVRVFFVFCASERAVYLRHLRWQSGRERAHHRSRSPGPCCNEHENARSRRAVGLTGLPASYAYRRYIYAYRWTIMQASRALMPFKPCVGKSWWMAGAPCCQHCEPCLMPLMTSRRNSSRSVSSSEHAMYP